MIFLLHYLHLMLEGKNPLIAFLCASKRSFSTRSTTKPVGIKLLRQAWNSFSRLLDINWSEAFLCPVCGPSPHTIICDGTLLGFRKDLLEHIQPGASQEASSVCKGSRHRDRVLLKSQKSRELLLKYSGYTKDRKCQQSPKELTATEFRQLQKLLKDEGATCLAELIFRLSSESKSRSSPQVFREFLSELSRNTPVCGLLQVAGNDEVLDIIDAIASGVDITQPSQREQLKLLQEHAPCLAIFIIKYFYGQSLPVDVCSLIQHLKQLTLAPFGDSEPDFCPPAQSSAPTLPLSFFPNLPHVRDKRVYSADVHSHTGGEDEDACRKYSSSHPTLTPGIFTIFCRHGICYGFEVMQSHESPRHPFDIFLCRFVIPPRIIIYDNGCKLHQYCLNREPEHFRNTKFLVDHFHWRGHIGCSSGYSLDCYTSLDIITINSQVNEQANAGLQRIKGQIAYMRPGNFMFHIKLFLALHNQDKLCQLDLSTIKL